jgi:hypothetical protein
MDQMLSEETEDEIDAIVRGIAPLDWVQIRRRFNAGSYID